MPKSRQVRTAASLMLLIVLGAALAACQDRKSTPPTPVSPTIPPVITRIVTPLPTNTPLPGPTLPYDVLSVGGRWIMRLDLEIDNLESGGSPLAQQLTYSGGAELQVGLDGVVTGSGHFSPTISSPPCDARAQGPAALTFTLSGNTYLDGDHVAIKVAIVPDSPDAPESFTLICPDFNDVRSYSQPLLWPVFRSLAGWNWGTASFQGLNWDFPLQSNQTYDFTADLSQDTGGQFGGTLIGEVRINRG
jgi:hypothetical protein